MNEPMKPTLLIVDDDEEIRTQMKWSLANDYEIHQAEDRESAVETFKSCHPIVTLLDLGLPPSPNDTTEGMATLENLLAIDARAKVIVVSGQGEKENAMRAVGLGAYDFHCKPVNMDELQLVLQRCVYVAELEREYHSMQEHVPAGYFEGIIAASPEMHEIFRMVRKVAKSSAPVLILGESGTGKEVVANAIHRQSPRKDKPFIAINCNAIPENLLESELFGHEKGSFTGAHARQKGLIEGAEGGTLFLDEIGELPPPIQVKLLRFLQEKRIQRVGGREQLEIDTRLVAATNADLQGAIKSGDFREDLYFRLAVVVLNLPPLRDRGNDVDLLANEFLRRFAEENDKKGLTFMQETMVAIRNYEWPGNVRELQNRIQRAVIMAESKRIRVEDVELSGAMGDYQGKTLKEVKEKLERKMVHQALARHQGKITAAAKELGVSRPTFYELMERVGINKEALK